jgi:hypothetical protein
VVGEWANWSAFDVEGPGTDDFESLSVAVPVGWGRQVNPDWQAAAFIAPMGHMRTGPGGAWAWEYMGGAFGRYLQDEHRAWIFGFFADVSPGEDLYLPYVGLLWVVTERWTVSAVMPWPGVTFAPRPDYFLHFGVTPSGASWSRSDGGKSVFTEVDAWNLGLSFERRFGNGFWLRAEAGVSGLRGLSFHGSNWQSPDTELGSSPYVSVGISYRPSGPASAAID